MRSPRYFDGGVMVDEIRGLADWSAMVDVFDFDSRECEMATMREK
jgi:hypothetical protein